MKSGCFAAGEKAIKTSEPINTSGLEWHGPDGAVKIGPFQLNGALIYTDSAPRSAEPSAVLTSKRLMSPQASVQSGRFNPYMDYRFYGGYNGMSNAERWGYLRWLQDGRPATRIEGYLLLFTEGLERRALVDGKDWEPIFHEVWRLWRLVGAEYWTFNYVAQELLWFLVSRIGEAIPVETMQILAATLTPSSHWDPDAGKKLSLLLWWCARRFDGVPDWAGYECARVSPDGRRTVVLERANAEMQRLFKLRFRKQFGEKIPLSLPPKARRRMVYEPINSSLTRFSSSWPDPLKLYTVWGQMEDEVVALYNGCQEDLRPLGLFLGRESSQPGSIAAWELLPLELRSGKHPALAGLQALGGADSEEGGLVSTEVGTVAALFGIPERESLTPTIARRLAASLGTCGYGMEPDARFTRKTCFWNEAAVLYGLPAKRKPKGMPLEFLDAAVFRYQTCAFALRLAFYLAQFNGPVSLDSCESILNRLSAAFAWDDAETCRFNALATLLLRVPAEKTAIKLPLQAKEFNRAAVAQLLLELVSSGGRVSHEQEEALRWAWKRLGMEPRKLNGELDTLSLKGTIFVGGSGAYGRGEKIPPPPGPVESVVLEIDRAAVAALLADTRHVQAALHQAMTVEDEELAPEPEPMIEVSPAQEEDFSGLPPRFAPLLLALLERDSWTEREAGALAREHSVMLAGAIEAINDWAFETLNAQLLWEDGENLSVERALLK